VEYDHRFLLKIREILRFTRTVKQPPGEVGNSVAVLLQLYVGMPKIIKMERDLTKLLQK